MPRPWRTVAELAAAAVGAPPQRAATALGALIDVPPATAFSGQRRRGSGNRALDPGLRTFDPAAARRLDAATRDLLAERGAAAP
jgi:hypothetical protein